MQTFKKRYVVTAEELSVLSENEKWKYYISRTLLNQKNQFRKNSEALVGKEEIEARGILCAPFWEDDHPEPVDSESAAFLAYIKENPNFTVYMRSKVLEKLVGAQSLLPRNVKIVVKAALRPIKVQQMLFDQEIEKARRKYGHWSNAKLRKHILEYVTDPAVNTPPHATGAALDVQLFNTQRKLYLDTGSPVNSIDDKSWCDNTIGFSATQKQNRAMLRNAMLSVGFAPLASEWWHYSYGDQRWAVYYNKTALYDAAEVPR